ncbi:MAG: hypothetical protein HY079_15185, partial [Elusimicrobia bacterium]|nr:hypothetical protein [Elusimicrobiota bacterium]
MKIRPLLLIASALLCRNSDAEHVLPDHQTYIEYQLSGVGVPAQLTQGIQKVWRSGNEFARAQFQIGGMGGAVTLVSAPYAYVLDFGGRRATRLGGPSDPQSAHLPIYPLAGISGAHDLEYGYEMEFFKEHEASRGKHEEIDGRECAVFRIRMQGVDGTLYIDLKERAPKRLTLEREGRNLTVDYLRYERRQPFEPDLFKPPAGFQVQGISVKRKDFDTPFDSQSPLPDNLRLQEFGSEWPVLLGRCRARPIFLALYRSSGPGADAIAAELRGLNERYRETAFCLFFVPRDLRGSSERREKSDFPRHRLLSYMELEDERSAKDYRLKDGSFVEVFKANGMMERLPLDGDPDRIDAKMAEALDEMGDLKDVPIGDIEEQAKSVDGEYLDFPLGRRIGEMIGKEDFGGLDAVFSDLRANKTRGTNGGWVIRSAYDRFSWNLNDDRSI